MTLNFNDWFRRPDLRPSKPDLLGRFCIWRGGKCQSLP